jgi:hypothetical protein
MPSIVLISQEGKPLQDQSTDARIGSGIECRFVEVGHDVAVLEWQGAIHLFVVRSKDASKLSGVVPYETIKNPRW